MSKKPFAFDPAKVLRRNSHSASERGTGHFPAHRTMLIQSGANDAFDLVSDTAALTVASYHS